VTKQQKQYNRNFQDGKDDEEGTMGISKESDDSIVNPDVGEYIDYKEIDDNNDNSEFSIEYLASEVHVSRMQLHRKIKSLTGKSASAYVRSYRLNKAMKIISDPSITISEVAWQVGFQDSSYFSKCFSIEFGMSPTEYREIISSDFGTSRNRDFVTSRHRFLLYPYL